MDGWHNSYIVKTIGFLIVLIQEPLKKLMMKYKKISEMNTNFIIKLYIFVLTFYIQKNEFQSINSSIFKVQVFCRNTCRKIFKFFHQTLSFYSEVYLIFKIRKTVQKIIVTFGQKIIFKCSIVTNYFFLKIIYIVFVFNA